LLSPLHPHVRCTLHRLDYASPGQGKALPPSATPPNNTPFTTADGRALCRVRFVPLQEGGYVGLARLCLRPRGAPQKPVKVGTT